MRAIARELRVAASTIRRTVKEDLRFLSYAKRRRSCNLDQVEATVICTE
jgi:hypothetical protein